MEPSPPRGPRRPPAAATSTTARARDAAAYFLRRVLGIWSLATGLVYLVVALTISLRNQHTSGTMKILSFVPGIIFLLMAVQVLPVRRRKPPR